MKNKSKCNIPTLEIDEIKLSGSSYVNYGKRWSAAKLVEYCKEQKYPIFDLPLAGISLDVLPWDIKDIADFIFEMKRIRNVDTSKPIILDNKGYICDGWHRVARAILDGKKTIKAIRIIYMPVADGNITE